MRKVSVIVPMLNSSKYVDSNIQYIVDQNYDNIEVIFVVDKRTNDDTVEKLNQGMKRLKDARIVCQSDGGDLGEARNIGIDNSSGDIIWFLDADDRPLPGFLRTLTDALETYDADVAFCNYAWSYTTDVHTDTGVPVFHVMDRLQALNSKVEERLATTSWSMISRAGLIRDNGLRFRRDGYVEDVDFTYRLLSKAERVCYTDSVLYIYLQNPTSISSSGKEVERCRTEMRIYAELREYFKENVPEFYDNFSVLSVRNLMRACVTMDMPNYLRIAKDENIRELIDKYRKRMTGPEMTVMRLSPRLYYYAVKLHTKLFSAEGKAVIRGRDR